MKSIVIDAKITYKDGSVFSATIQPGTVACDQMLYIGRYAKFANEIASVELSNPRIEEIEDCLEWFLGKAEEA